MAGTDDGAPRPELLARPRLRIPRWAIMAFAAACTTAVSGLLGLELHGFGVVLAGVMVLAFAWLLSHPEIGMEPVRLPYTWDKLVMLLVVLDAVYIGRLLGPDLRSLFPVVFGILTVLGIGAIYLIGRQPPR